MSRRDDWIDYQGPRAALHLRVVNALGQVLTDRTFKATSRLQQAMTLSPDWAEGVYLIQLAAGTRQWTYRLMVER